CIITVELAGVKNPETVRKYLQATAKLQFWEVATMSEIGNQLVAANTAIEQYLKAQKGGTTTPTVDTTKPTTTDSTALTSNDTTKETSLESLVQGDNTNSLENATLNTDSNNVAANENLFTYMMPTISPEGQIIPSSAIGIVAKKDAQKVLDLLNLEVAKRNFRKDIKFLLGENPFARMSEDKIERVGIYA